MKTPKRNYIAGFVLIFTIILAFTACDDPSNSRGNNEGETTFTVRFDRNGGRGTVPDPITVSAGSSITLPDGDGLSKSGYVFGGWNTEADGAGINYDEGESFTPTANVTLYAQWDEVVTYAVSFNSNGGSNVEAQTVNAGDRATRPANPTKSGYIFAGWCRNAALTVGYNFSTPVAEDITLYARWVAVSAGSFIVTFDSNGGSSVDMGIVQSGGTATRPADPTQSGYTFDNWYSDESLTTVYNFSTPVTGNITLYAKWAPVVTYTVSFDGNGATGGAAPAAQTTNAGSNITLPSGRGLSKTGSAFGGWNTRADGAGTNHAADSSYTVQNNITLYALWIIVSADSFIVTFDSNGGSSVDMEIVQSGDTATRPANPTRDNYTFDNWYSNAGLTAVYNFFTPVTENIILYAKWTLNQYAVTFNSNGGSSVATQTVNSGGTATRPANPTRSGYTFDNWYSDSGLTTVYNFSSPVMENIILYAKWTLNQYTVTFNSNGGSSVATQTVNSGGTATRPTNPTRSNYTFDNWYSNSGLTTVYNFYTPVMENIILYAKWTLNQYTVTFNSNGGSSVATQTVNSGSTATRPTNPTRNGYTFDNWYSDSGLTTVYNFSTLVTGNIVLYAKWIATYTVTFNSNGGSSVATQTVNSGSTATRPADPTRSNYTFDNWYSDSGLTTVYNFSTLVTGNIILYAKWIATYTVTFNSNGGSSVATQTVNSGSTATRPTNPTRNNYTFDNWYSNENLTTVYNFSTLVTGNITLYAKWDSPIITINTQPATSTYVTVGNISGSLSVAASVTNGATPSYQWYSNTTNNNTDGSTISGAISASYTIPSTLIAGIYYYFCEIRATGVDSVRSNVAMVIVRPRAEWAQSVSGGLSSEFNSVAVDTSGNVYAAGYQSGTGTFNYGNNVTATGDGNGVLVKYNANGTAQWAQSVSGGGGDLRGGYWSRFNSVAVDTSGNVYAAGYQVGTGNYGNNVTATGSYNGDGSVYRGLNGVLVKYNTNGVAQWVRTTVNGTHMTSFSSVVVDTSGNVYAAGYQYGTGTFNYGNNVTATSGDSYSNAVLVKYNANGIAQWARTVFPSSQESEFNSVAVDTSGNVYAASSQYGNGTGTFNYGNNVTATGDANGVLVKYNANGTAQWAQSVSGGSSSFNSVAVDTSGNVYAAGRSRSDINGVLVKYNTNGTAQWAQSVSGGLSSSFNSVAVDTSGNVYTAGDLYGTGTFNYGNNVTATGSSSSNNVVLVKYNTNGTAQWAQSVSGGLSSSFNSVAVDTSGNVYAAGYQSGTGIFNYGNNVTATGSYSGDNVVLVKYKY